MVLIFDDRDRFALPFDLLSLRLRAVPSCVPFDYTCRYIRCRIDPNLGDFLMNVFRTPRNGVNINK